MKLWAVADLHLRYPENRAALETLAPRPDDWLIVAGDVGEAESELHFALGLLTQRFAQVLWVPGNHDLWTSPSNPDGPRGDAKYRRMVEICRGYRVLTPEDPYPVWPGPVGRRPAAEGEKGTAESPAQGSGDERNGGERNGGERNGGDGTNGGEAGEGGRVRIAPLFLLYDYSFRPDHVAPEDAVQWAMEAEILCADEMLLHPDPYPSRPAWCEARCRSTELRLLEATSTGDRLVLVHHWPLHRDLSHLPAVPRFIIWCGTRRTADWHQRFRAEVLVHGHLHIPRTQWLDGVRAEEVSFGYPRNWQRRGRTIEQSLRQILPHP